MNVSVIGCGRWGSFIAWYLNKVGHKVFLYGRENSENYRQLVLSRKNNYLTLPDEIKLTSDLKEIIDNSNIIAISVGAQNLRGLCKEIDKYDLENKIFVLCMKGLEETTGKRLTEVFEEEIHQDCKIAIWVGPGHVQDFINGIPNCMIVSSKDIKTSEYVVELFKDDSNLIRFYYGDDLVGNEIGAASKNVIGIAAGMLDGLGYSSLKGSLMSRGTREIGRLIVKLGGKENTVYGLSHLGDYEATLFSIHSNNRSFGEKYIKKQSFDKLAEGVYTVKAIVSMAKDNKVELPICSAIYDIIYNNKEPQLVLDELFNRSIKLEYEQSE